MIMIMMMLVADTRVTSGQEHESNTSGVPVVILLLCF